MLEEEKSLRRGLVEKALHALTVEVDGQTVFEDQSIKANNTLK